MRGAKTSLPVTGKNSSDIRSLFFLNITISFGDVCIHVVMIFDRNTFVTGALCTVCITYWDPLFARALAPASTKPSNIDLNPLIMCCTQWITNLEHSTVFYGFFQSPPPPPPSIKRAS